MCAMQACWWAFELCFVHVHHSSCWPPWVPRLIQHTKSLMSSEEKLCIKVLRTLQEMLIHTYNFDDKVKVTVSILEGHVLYHPVPDWRCCFPTGNSS